MATAEVMATADVARRAEAVTPAAAAAVSTITSTVYQTTYTVTSTTTSLATPSETFTETYYEVVTTTLTPPPETVCEGNPGATITLINKLPPQTQTQVVYRTFNTWITVWVGYVAFHFLYVRSYFCGRLVTNIVSSPTAKLPTSTSPTTMP